MWRTRCVCQCLTAPQIGLFRRVWKKLGPRRFKERNSKTRLVKTTPAWDDGTVARDITDPARVWIAIRHFFSISNWFPLQQSRQNYYTLLRRAVFPALIWFEFRGVSNYLEDLVARIDSSVTQPACFATSPIHWWNCFARQRQQRWTFPSNILSSFWPGCISLNSLKSQSLASGWCRLFLRSAIICLSFLGWIGYICKASSVSIRHMTICNSNRSLEWSDITACSPSDINCVLIYKRLPRA